MKIGISTSLNNTALAQAAGFDYIEANIQNLLVAEAPDADFAANLKAAQSSPLPVPAANAFLPPALKCVGPEIDNARLDRYAEVSFRRAKQVGIRYMVFGSGGARNIPDGFSRDEARRQFVDYVRRIAPLALAHDVILVIECLNKKECNFLNVLDEGAAIVEEIKHPNIRLLADLYHMLLEGETEQSLIRHAHLIDHVHVAEKEGRQAPGTSGEDFGPFLRALKKTGYKGAISYECGWKNLAEQAAPSLKSFHDQLTAAGW